MVWGGKGCAHFRNRHDEFVNALRMVIGIAISAIGFLYLLFAYVMIGWGWSDSGSHWNATQWTLTIVPWSVPFLFSLWFVYRCVDSSLKRAAIAELSGCIAGFLFLVAFFFLQQEPRVLLEQPTPIAETTNRLEALPDLPLRYEAVGVELPDGKFNPIMFLATPIPRDGYKKPLLTVDLKAGAPRIKIFRGTNELAGENHFLGQFEIVNYPKSKSSMQLMLFFSVDEKRRLFMQARDVDETHNTALKLKRVPDKF